MEIWHCQFAIITRNQGMDYYSFKDYTCECTAKMSHKPVTGGSPHNKEARCVYIGHGEIIALIWKNRPWVWIILSHHRLAV